SPDWVRTRKIGASTISSATSNPGRTIALEALRLQPSARVKARARHSEATPIRTFPPGSFIAPSTLIEADSEKPQFMPKRASKLRTQPKKQEPYATLAIPPSQRSVATRG